MWTESQEAVLSFAHVLHRAGWFDDIDEVLYYWEKPHKWDNAHKAWVVYGCPSDTNEDGWELFAKALEKLS